MHRLNILIPALCAFLGAAGQPFAQESKPLTALVWAVAVSPDGSLVAAGHFAGKVALLDAKDGKRIQFLAAGLGDTAWGLAFSPDGERLAGIGHDGRLRLWTLNQIPEGNAASSELVDALPADDLDEPHLPDHFGLTMAWSPTGRRLVVADYKGDVSLWTNSGKLVKRWNRGRMPTDENLAWTQDGSLLLTADGASVQLRDGDTGELRPDDAPLREIQCPHDVVAMAVHPRENLLVTGHVGCRVIVWDLESGKRVTEGYFPDPIIPKDDGEVASIAYSPSGDRLAISNREGCNVFVLDPERLTKVWSSEYLGGHFGEAVRVSWSPNGSRLWFAFECGAGELYCVTPEDDSEPMSLENTSVTTFGSDVGAIISGGTVHAVTSDGVVKW